MCLVLISKLFYHSELPRPCLFDVRPLICMLKCQKISATGSSDTRFDMALHSLKTSEFLFLYLQTHGLWEQFILKTNAYFGFLVIWCFQTIITNVWTLSWLDFFLSKKRWDIWGGKPQKLEFDNIKSICAWFGSLGALSACWVSVYGTCYI